MSTLRERLARQAMPYLDCLLNVPPDDAWCLPVHFQTFDDDQARKASQGGKDPRARHWTGGLDRNAEELDRLNQDRAGIYVTVNGTDGKGRAKASIRQLRGWWADLDAKDATVPFDVRTVLDSLLLAPTMAVRTPGGLHLYWLAKEPIPCEGLDATAKDHEADLKQIQAHLAPFGADRHACEIARVLRLPGFNHCKADPRPVELLVVDGPRYTRDQVLAAFPALEKTQVPPTTPVSVKSPPAAPLIDRAEVLHRAGLYLGTLPPGVQGEGGSGPTFNAALKVQDGFDLTEGEALDLMLQHYNPRCEPPWSVEELRKKVRDTAPLCRDRGHLLRMGKTSSQRTTKAPTEPASSSDCAGDLNAELARLAALPPLEYEQIRKAASETLGIRASVLDKAVEGVREASQGDSSSMFPEVLPWEDPVDVGAVLGEIRATIQRHIICEPSTAVAAALWVAFTWLVDHVQVAPIAVITAPQKRCGKSQLLDLIGRMAFRPLVASNVSPAAVYRVIETHRPTLLIDEADSFLKDNEELRGVINSGHTRQSAYVLRTVGEEHEPKRFSTWGPKVLSGIGKLQSTIMDRAIVLELRRKLKHERVERLRHSDPGHFERLSRQLSRVACDHAGDVARARPHLPEALNDRAQDNWEPLLAIADLAGGDWPRLARSVALHLAGGVEEDTELPVLLLADVREIFERLPAELVGGKPVKRIPTGRLLVKLADDDTHPWKTFDHGSSMSPKQLADMLKPFGIKSVDLKYPGNVVQKGYRLDQFEDAFDRYLDTVAVADESATSYQSATSEPAPTLEVAAVADQRGVSGDVCALPHASDEVELVRTIKPELMALCQESAG